VHDVVVAVRARLLAALLLLATPAVAAGVAADVDAGAALAAFPNAAGLARTASTLGPGDDAQPFFRPLNAGGRACATCHVPAQGWSVTPAGLRARFDASAGLDPIFQPADAAVAPTADVGTVEARRAAYRLLLERGLLRVGLPMPPDAEFTLVAVDDPAGWASARDLSLFRRPLPTTNLRFLTSVMWDGRASAGDEPLAAGLARQARAAVHRHAGLAYALSPDDERRLLAFETSLTTAQVWDRAAGATDAAGADGGLARLAEQAFRRGINSGPAFTPRVFTLFTPWREQGGARAAIARGEAVFNERSFARGAGRCSSCHNAPNVGVSSTGLFFDLGLSRENERLPGMPLYTFRCTTTGHLVRTTDPGRALVTGRCEDFDRFKVPSLRGLAARPPYFHDGRAATLDEVIDVYERRLGLGLTATERSDLVAFLRAL
jgi:cytochrome c peroxidase